eukprot:523550-Pyramimonas_sp.AAC.1
MNSRAQCSILLRGANWVSARPPQRLRTEELHGRGGESCGRIRVWQSLHVPFLQTLSRPLCACSRIGSASQTIWDYLRRLRDLTGYGFKNKKRNVTD